jgi:hypothetical protein
MSTIKSSDEHLTLNADGSSKDIKFQANGVEKASISSAGVMTATSFAGSGANLTSLPADSSKVDKANPTITNDLTIDDASNTPTINFRESDSALKMRIGFGTNTTDVAEWNVSPAKDIKFVQNSATNLTIKSDGRGLSQFTAKAWARFSASGLNDSHNIDTFVDNGTGDYTLGFTVHMTGSSYAALATGHANMFMGIQAAPSTSAVRFKQYNDHGNAEDGDWHSAVIFGD